MMNPITVFIFVATLVAALGVPMALRKVPPNRLYGLRVAATFADESVWYEANARSGRDLVIAGISIMLLGVILSRFELPDTSCSLICGIYSAAAVVGAAIRGWRLAEKLRRKRQTSY